MFKFVVSFAVLSVAYAGVVDLGYHSNYYQPAAYVQPATVVKQIQPAIVKQVSYEQPANYQFNYDVHDSHTGDIKRQQEVASNGVISGEYSLYDSDGFRRTVSYTADDAHGFQAKVQREPLGQKIVAAPVVTKVIQPAPIVTKVVQPAVTKFVQPVSHGWAQPNAYANPWG